MQRWQSAQVKRRRSTDRQPFDNLSRRADDWGRPDGKTPTVEQLDARARQRQDSDTYLSQVCYEAVGASN